MKTYAEFLKALKDWTAKTGWEIYTATDIYKAAQAAGFSRAEIVEHYGRYRRRHKTEDVS